MNKRPPPPFAGKRVTFPTMIARQVYEGGKLVSQRVSEYLPCDAEGPDGARCERPNHEGGPHSWEAPEHPRSHAEADGDPRAMKNKSRRNR